MKLLFVARRFPPDVRSGTETVFSTLYRLAASTDEARLVVGWRTSPAQFPEGAVAVDLRGGGPGAYLRLAAAAEREARAWRPDAVLSNSVEVVPATGRTALIVHDLNFGRAGRAASAGPRELVYRLQCGRAARVVAVSEATRDRLVAIGVPAGRIEVIPNGVDLDVAHGPPPPAPPVSPPAPLRAPPAPVVRFVCPGRILPGKGQHAAIDALGRLRPDQRWRARLTVVGAVADPIYLDQLRVQAFGLPVEFATDVPDLAPYYRDSDVVLFPTLMEEGFGLVALEAMAHGRPVIYYDQPAVRGATGGVAIPVARDDAAALRDAMWRLMEDPARREALGRAGRTHAERRGWATVWSEYRALLAGVAR